MHMHKIGLIGLLTLWLVACGGGGTGGTGGSGGTAGSGGAASSVSSSSSGTGGAPVVPWEAGLLESCSEVYLVGQAPAEDDSISVQRITPPEGAMVIDGFSVTFPRAAGQSEGPYAAFWAMGTEAGLSDMPAVIGEKTYDEADLTWTGAAGIELATATIDFDPPLVLAAGDVFYPGVRISHHGGGVQSTVALCVKSVPEYDPAAGQASLFSHSLGAGKGTSQCPGDCRLDKLATFGFPWPLLVSVRGH